MSEVTWPERIVLALAVLILFVVAVLGATTTQCDQQPHGGYERASQENHQYCAANGVMVETRILYRGLHRYQEDINAFATTVLAFFTIVLAGATIFLWKSSEKHALHMEDIVKTARAEFNTTHRPKLVIRNVRIIFEGISTQPVGQRLMVQFELVNIGESEAQVIATSMSINFLTVGNLQIDQFPRLGQFALPDHQNIVLAPGEFRECWYGNPERRYIPDMVRSYTAAHGLFFCGHVIYQDGNKVTRRTTFCRRYGSERGYWPANTYYDYEQVD